MNNSDEKKMSLCLTAWIHFFYAAETYLIMKDYYKEGF